MKHKITLGEIKTFLENKSGIRDISTKNRSRFISDLRKSYCALSKIFTSYSLEEIGHGLREDYNHDNVIYNINKFNEIYPTNGLECIDIHNEAFKHFSELNGSYPLASSDVEEVKRSYNTKMNKAIHKFFLAIEKRDDKIKKLENENKALKRKIELFNKTIFSKI